MRTFIHFGFVLSIAAAGLLGGYAISQEIVSVDDGVVAVVEPSAWQVFWKQTIEPAVISIAGAVIAAAVAYGIKLLRDKTGVDISKQQQEIQNLLQSALQAAIGRAAGIAINELGPRALELTKTSDPAVTKGLEYVKATMKDNLPKSGLSEQRVREAIVGQIGEKIAPALGAAAAVMPEDKLEKPAT